MQPQGRLARQQIVDLALGKIDEGAVEQLSDLAGEGFLALKGDFPATAVIGNYAEILKRNQGLLEVWLTLNMMTLFAAGVAAGRDHEKITEHDLEIAKGRMCEKWPECSAMRITAASNVLRLLAESARR